MARHTRPKICLPASHFETLERRVLLTVTAPGMWTALANAAPGQVPPGLLLLPNGSVMAQLQSNGDTSYALLTPDAQGSYVNGTWTQTANSKEEHSGLTAQVLPDGRVFIAGGEVGGLGGSSGETYDPLTNSWSLFPQNLGAILDAESTLLPNGTVLIAPVRPNPSGYTTIFDPSTNTWSQGPQLYGNYPNADEDTWIRLQDDSILLTPANGVSERYIPAQNEWIPDRGVPDNLIDAYTNEEGAAMLLPDGRAFFLGGTGHTAIYSPTGTPAEGSWVAGPDVPNGLAGFDEPMAMLPDGTILCAVGPVGTQSAPSTFYVYNWQTNSFEDAPAPDVAHPEPAGTLLDLPNGQVLYATKAGSLYVYSAGTPPLAAATPVIEGITNNADGTLTLHGRGLNGLDSGSAYGDDQQNNTNYPIISLTSGNNVYYATSRNWSTSSVATGSLDETVDFTLPLGIPPGTYSVETSANGVMSTPVSLTISTTTNNSGPRIATSATASPGTITGTTTNLSVLGADDGGESNLTYTWTTSSAPRATATPTFSINGTNAAKNTAVTFHQAGNYTFEVTATDAGGLSAVSFTTTVTCQQSEDHITLTPALSNLSSGGNEQLAASAIDQFGFPMSPQPTLTWSVTNGGSLSGSGMYASYTAPAFGTLATVQVGNNTFAATAQIGVVPSPWSNVDVGGTSAPGFAYPTTNGAFTIEGSGNWSNGGASHFVYQSLPTDGMITARLATEEAAALGFGTAGLMIRDSLDPSSPFVDLLVTSNGSQMLASSGPVEGDVIQQGAPSWVRLVRNRDTITGYLSTDGITWIAIGSINETFGTSVDIGLTVGCPIISQLCTATFDNVSVESNVSSDVVLTAGSGTNPSYDNQALSFIAHVTGVDGSAPSDGDQVLLEDSSNSDEILATGTTNAGFSTLAVLPGSILAGQHELFAVYEGDATYAPSESQGYFQNVQVAITSVVINGDNPNGLYVAAGQPTSGVQRSMVEDVVYSFSEPVTVDDGAFTIALAGQKTGTLPTNLIVSTVAGTNNMEWAVSLTGEADGILGSIANGEYSITIDPNSVYTSGGATFSSVARTDYFYRIFGDIDGNEVVNSADNSQLQTALVTYNAAFDFNCDGFVNAFDNFQFKKSMSIQFLGDGFTPTV